MKKSKILKFLLILLTASSSVSADYLNDKIVLFPIKKAELAPLVDSTIIKFNYKAGETFSKGDVLIQLDNSLYKEMYTKTKADVYRTQETYKYTDSLYKYNKTLFQKNAVGEQELEESKITAIKSLAENEQAKANYKIAEIKLNSCTIEAPFSGRVISEIENEYDYVREGQPIIEIADDNQLLAVMNLPSDMIRNISIGTELKFKIDEINLECSGKVYSISASINPGSRTVEIKALIENDNKQLRIGMSGELLTEISNKHAEYK